jgi:AcrR family transcriptional regulator
MSKTINESKHQEQVLKIIGKARSLFAEKGYAETSMSDIAEASELQKATLYHYFDSKDALLFGILECHAHEEEVKEHFDRVFPGASLEERFYQVAKFHLGEMDKKDNFDFMKILLVEATTGSDRMKEYFQSYMRKQMDAFVKGVIAPAMEDRMSEIEMNRLGFQFSAALMYYSWQSRLLGRFEDKVGPEDDYIRALAKIFGKQGV